MTNQMGTIVGARFTALPDHQEVEQFTLANAAGVEVSVLSWGARLASIRVPDRNGRLANILLAHERPADWLNDTAALGATIGRTANRIAGARCELDGRTLTLPANDGAHHLHGGPVGFDRQLWQGSVTQESDGSAALTLFLDSADGDQGYPGRLQVHQRYTLDSRNALSIETWATSDATTLFAPTWHPYFNLSGAPHQTIRRHTLQLDASQWLPVDGHGIPTGRIDGVDGTPLDFRQPTPIGDRLDNVLLAPRRGYDHALLLDKPDGTLGRAAVLTDPISGRRLSLTTTLPSVQLYTANGLHLPAGDRRYCGVCIEPQHPPDAVHHDLLPTPLLHAGQRYHARSTYRFDTVSAATTD